MLPDQVEGAAGGGGAVKAMDQAPGVLGSLSQAEFEDDLTLLSGGQVKAHLDRPARVEAGAHLPGKAGAGHGRRRLQAAVASQEFRAIAGERARRLIDREKGRPVAELGVVGVARQERAALRVGFGDHMHGRFRPQITQHPLDKSGGRELAGAVRVVAHHQHHELDGRIRGHVHRQGGADAAFGVLENGVAESVPGGVGGDATTGQRRRRPVMAALLVTQVQGLAARIADRIVGPGRKPELMRVLPPGVGKPALGDDRAEVRVGEHIHPRGRGQLPLSCGDDIFAPVRGETAQAVVEGQVQARRKRHRQGFGTMGPGRNQGGHGDLGRAAAFDLFQQRSPLVGEDGAGNGLHQDTVLLGHLVPRPHENAAGPVDDVGLQADGNQPHDLIVEQLAIAGAILVPDHQVHGQALEAPVGVGLHQLPHQFDIGRILDLQQHDRQVAGDGIAPQP